MLLKQSILFKHKIQLIRKKYYTCYNEEESTEKKLQCSFFYG